MGRIEGRKQGRPLATRQTIEAEDRQAAQASPHFSRQIIFPYFQLAFGISYFILKLSDRFGCRYQRGDDAHDKRKRTRKRDGRDK